MSTKVVDWSEENVTKAYRMWRDGISASAIARKLGPEFTKNMVLGLANRKREMFPARKKAKKMSVKIDVDIDAVAKMWNDTPMTSAEIGKMFGASATFVRSLAGKYPGKFVKRPSGGSKPSQKAKKTPITATWFKPARDSVSLPVVSYKSPELDEYETARLPGVLMVDNKGCNWPLNEGGPFLFCGCEKYQLKPYCRYHVIKARGEGTPSERSAVKDAKRVA